ncbi:MAG: NusA-like transcription termination signal-binding factor [Methanomicrobiales archaeon]|nr:NusA-like transcription termination signal-binding factor [Methanomicrobiales archaeon]
MQAREMMYRMLEGTLGFKERRYIEELRILTGSTAVDCVSDDRFDRVIYVIKPGDMGLAIGRGGENIRKLQKVLGRKIELVEYAEDLESFIRNIFKPIPLAGIELEREWNSIDVLVEKKGDLGIAIGKGGANVEKARILVKRHFGLEIRGIRIAEGRREG